jgi:II/X family phage/plasmid replication protein
MQFYKELQNSLKDIDLNGVIPINKIKDFNLLSVYTPELLEFTKGMIRFEATVKADWLRQRDYSQHFDTFKEQFDPQKIWQESFKDLFFLLESKTMTINDYNEDHIKHELQKHFVTYNKKGQASFTSANNAFKTFLLIKQCGYNKALEQFKTQRDGTKLNQTWYRHLEMLRTIGLIDIYLQGFKDGKDSTSTVVPLLIFSKVDFSAQFPTFYKDAA